MPNLFENLPESLPDELHETLASGVNLRIDRIVSPVHVADSGQATQADDDTDGWYDQEQAEWVMVLQGVATLQFQDQPQLTRLKSGDWIQIPPHRRHRVQSTSDQVPTVWLAIYYDASTTIR
ncbi:cupin domain-containing protein [Planctomycetes bacterium K23_9]|uniref:Cupin domain protein n=1 Tax=Stieleria marina TaxID=1930275 RepID=A0A517P045_9BACT|nr:Cupin domain protein [Planctomycetes bacterium K23_9]